MTRRVGRQSATVRRPGRRAVPLAVPPGVGLRVTAEGFLRLCRANPDLRLERSARGVLQVMSPTSGDAGVRNAELTAQVVAWSKADGTGKAFDSSTGFTLPNGADRSPDAAWIALDRWNALTPQQKQEGFVPLCPDFMAEIRSRSNRLPTLRKKIREYITQGVRLAWLIDPIQGKVEVYRPGRPVELFDRPATLSGEDVLPGFVLDLKGILFD